MPVAQLNHLGLFIKGKDPELRAMPLLRLKVRKAQKFRFPEQPS